MNKYEAFKHAKECAAGIDPTSDGYVAVFTSAELLAFANACEKIGMEKAAEICTVQVQEYHPDGQPRSMEYVCADAIRKAIE